MSNRAPKGGITIEGVFYKGGQFLPTNEPQRGKWNSRNQTKKTRKVQIEPYVWVEAREGYRPMFNSGGAATAALWDADKKTYTEPHSSPIVLNYCGVTRQQVENFIARWNAGERWVKDED